MHSPVGPLSLYFFMPNSFEGFSSYFLSAIAKAQPVFSSIHVGCAPNCPSTGSINATGKVQTRA
jgi:hypothetical protein